MKIDVRKSTEYKKNVFTSKQLTNKMILMNH